MAKRLEDKRIWGYARKQCVIFLVLGLGNLFAGLVYSIPAPFYPREAESKGASATEYGFVLGVYELVNFIVSPIFGSYMNSIGCIRAFQGGVILTGIMTIGFGFLHFVEGHALFIGLSFLIRIPQAIGGAAVFTASVTIVTVQFSESIAATFAAMEAFYGFGYCVGPTIGAALYSVGGDKYGFPLPFITLGSCLLISAPISAILLWNHDMRRSRSGGLELATGTKSALWSLLRIPSIDLYIFAVISASVSVSFLSAVLEPRLRLFSVSEIITGLMFLLYAGVYALTAPLWGMLCDGIGNPKFITLTGALAMFIAFMCIGPAPFLDIEPKFWLMGVGLCIFGLGLGAIFVSSFILSLQDARKSGFPDNLNTYALVCGLWRSSVAFGSFVGPSLAGVLYDVWGFRNETLFILGLHGVLILLVLIFLIKKSKKPGWNCIEIKREELRPILSIETYDEVSLKMERMSLR